MYDLKDIILKLHSSDLYKIKIYGLQLLCDIKKQNLLTKLVRAVGIKHCGCLAT